MPGAVRKTAKGRRNFGQRRNASVNVHWRRPLPECVDQCNSVASSSEDESSDATADSSEADTDDPRERVFIRGKSLQPMIEPPQIETFPAGFQVFRQLLIEGDPRARPYTLQDAQRQEERAWRRRCAADKARGRVSADISDAINVSSGSDVSDSKASSNLRAKSPRASRITAGNTRAFRTTAGRASVPRNTADRAGSSHDTSRRTSASRDTGNTGDFSSSIVSSYSDDAPEESSSAEEADLAQRLSTQRSSKRGPRSGVLNGPGRANSEMRGHSAPSVNSEKQGSSQISPSYWRGQARERRAVQVPRDPLTAQSNDGRACSGYNKAGNHTSGYDKADNHTSGYDKADNHEDGYDNADKASHQHVERQESVLRESALHSTSCDVSLMEHSTSVVFVPGWESERGEQGHRNSMQTIPSPTHINHKHINKVSMSKSKRYSVPIYRRVNRLPPTMSTLTSPDPSYVSSLDSKHSHNTSSRSSGVRRAISAPVVGLTSPHRDSYGSGHTWAASDAQRSIQKEEQVSVSIGRRSGGLPNADRRSVAAGKAGQVAKGGAVLEEDQTGPSTSRELLRGPITSPMEVEGGKAASKASNEALRPHNGEGRPHKPTPSHSDLGIRHRATLSPQTPSENLPKRLTDETRKIESPTQVKQPLVSIVDPPSEDVTAPVRPSTTTKAREKPRVLERYNTFPEIETALFEWVLTQIERGVSFTDNMIHEDAHRIARQLKLDDAFHASAYWIEGWKRQVNFDAIHPKSRLRGAAATTSRTSRNYEGEAVLNPPASRKGGNTKGVERRGRKPGVKSQSKKPNESVVEPVPPDNDGEADQGRGMRPKKRRKNHDDATEDDERSSKKRSSYVSSRKRQGSNGLQDKKQINNTLPDQKQCTELPDLLLDSSSTRTHSTNRTHKRTRVKGQHTTCKRAKPAKGLHTSMHRPPRRSTASKGLSRRQVRNILASNAPSSHTHSASEAEQQQLAKDTDSDYVSSSESMPSPSAHHIRTKKDKTTSHLATGESTVTACYPHQQVHKTLENDIFSDLGIQNLNAITRPKQHVDCPLSTVSPSGSTSLVPDLTPSCGSSSSIAESVTSLRPSLLPLPPRASLRASTVSLSHDALAHVKLSVKAPSNRCGLCGCAGERWQKVHYASLQGLEASSLAEAPVEAQVDDLGASLVVREANNRRAGDQQGETGVATYVHSHRSDFLPSQSSTPLVPDSVTPPLASDAMPVSLPVQTTEVWFSGAHQISSTAFEIDYIYQDGPCVAEKRAYPLCKACIDGDGEVCIFKNFRMLPKDLACSYSDGFVPLLVDAINTSDDIPVFPEAWYQGMTERDLRVVLSASTALRPTLEREIQHARLPHAAKTTHKLDVSTFCDTCLHSVFSGSWMCCHCSSELCFSCYEDLCLITENSPLSEGISTAQKERLSVCYGGTTHTPGLFSPLVRILPSLIEKTLKEMNSLSLEPTRPVNRIATESLDELYLSYSPDFHVSYSQEYMDGQITGYEGSISAGLSECDYASHAVLSLHAGYLRSLYLEMKDSADSVFEDVFGTDFCHKMDACASGASIVERLRHIFSAEQDSSSEQLPIQFSPSLLSEAEVTHGLFQHIWSIGEPLVYETGKGDELSKKISPAMFIERYGAQECSVLSNLDTESLSSTIGAFFKTFGHPLTPDQIPRYSYKLKDWPPTNDFKNDLPDVFNVYTEALPIPAMTRRDGALNLAANSPTNSNAPDLGPKGYFSHASLDIEGGTGSTKLHMDVADAVNIMAWAGPDQFGKPGGALWDIFRAEDSDKIRDFIFEVTSEENRMSTNALRETSDDPIHVQQIYLDVALRKKLYETKGVKPFHIYQRPGQAVFIPAGCAHQVCNVTDCIKIASDFVSHQNVSRCWTLSSEFRQQTRTDDLWRSDILALKSQLFWTWQRCFHELEKRFSLHE